MACGYPNPGALGDRNVELARLDRASLGVVTASTAPPPSTHSSMLRLHQHRHARQYRNHGQHWRTAVNIYKKRSHAIGKIRVV